MLDWQKIHKTIGPGILFASTAIGVSHLVQSTRAGTLYGFGLIWAVVLANLFKYPFFEFGSRYANVTGTSLIDGYMKIGKAALIAYLLLTLGTMFFVTAAVGAVTAGFLDNLFGLYALFGENSLRITTGILFGICMLALLIGRYRILDSTIKVIGASLAISTVLAFILILIKGPVGAEPLKLTFEIDYSSSGIALLIALMGWMPTAVDLSTWNSLWTLERIRQTGYKPQLRETLADFNIGYLISALLAVCFVVMGAYMFFGASVSLPDQSHLFASEVIHMYTQSIGHWSYSLIALAGFSIMFGTCLAIFDGYSRSAERSIELFLNTEASAGENKRNYRLTLCLVGAGAFFIIMLFGSSLKSLIDLATTLSFLVAPLIAVANYYLVSSGDFPQAYRPSRLMHLLSISGILFLTGFSIFYLITVIQ